MHIYEDDCYHCLSAAGKHNHVCTSTLGVDRLHRYRNLGATIETTCFLKLPGLSLDKKL